MALRDLLNKSKYQEPIRFGDSAPTLAIKIGKKLFGDKTTTRTLPNGGGTYESPTVGTQPQQDFSGLYGTNQNYQGSGGFNYATQQAADQAKTQAPSQDDSLYSGLLDGSSSGYGDTSTSNHDTMYTMSKIDEVLGGKSPEDLWTLRQRLAQQQALALGGLLPAQQQNAFNGEGVTTGTPNYDLTTRAALNKSAADIFSPQIENLDAYIHDIVDKTKNGSSSYSISNIPKEMSDINVKAIIDTASMAGKSIEERANIRNMLSQSLSSGDSATFLNDISRYGIQKMTAQETENYKKLQPNIDAITTAIGYINQYDGDIGNLKSLRNKIGKQFGYDDPKYSMINFLLEGVSADKRKEIFGASLTGGEQDSASSFIITKKDTRETAIQKAKAMMIAMQMAQEIAPLAAAGVTQQELQKLKNSGVIKSYTDRLVENGITPPGQPAYPYTQVGSDGKKYRVISASEVVPLDSFKRVGTATNSGSGKEIVAGYDITSYATDPLHGKKVQNIYSKIPENIDSYIAKIAPNSPIRASNVLASANKYGVDPKLVLAIMVQDSTLGTAGKAVRTRNPGNVGNTDSGATRTYATWQDGVDAVAKNLSRRKIYNV